MRPCLRLIVLILIVLAVPTVIFAQDSEQVTYTIQRGDTLFRIALRYGVTVDALAQANSIGDITRIKAGQTLVIPGLTQPTESIDVINPLVAAAPVTHKITRGETLATIANQYHVTVDEILKANNIANPDRIVAGQELQIWTNDLSDENVVEITAAAPGETAPGASVEAVPQGLESVPDAAPEVAAPVPATTYTTYVVQDGEYLSAIARRFGISWTLIAEANNITDPNMVYAGMELRIPDASSLPFGDVVASVAEVPPAHVGVGREVVVDLSTQMTYAYEDGILQYSALSSTGLPATPTVQGDYAVYVKYDAQRMVGPGYDLPNVQWVMYFYQGYALHGTYWHNNFGHPMSHGCVNLRNEDALWFYNWASVGTPVHVQW